MWGNRDHGLPLPCFLGDKELKGRLSSIAAGLPARFVAVVATGRVFSLPFPLPQTLA